MVERKIFKTMIGGKEVIVETGAYCGLASGSCIIRCGDTAVMVNTTMAKTPRDGVDFFPLGCDYEEKMYAVGKIPGGFKKREARASDKAILVSRLIDRPLRPLFPKGFYNDVAVVATTLSVDPNFPPEVYAMIGSSVALSISDIPFAGPTGSVIVGYVDGKFVINPEADQRDASKLHLALSGTKEAILMVEAGANELTEEEMISAILFGHEEIKKIVAWIEEIQAQIGKEKIVPELYAPSEEVANAVKAYAQEKMVEVLTNFNRQDRQEAEEALDKEVFDYFAEKFPSARRDIFETLYKMKKTIIRSKILNDGIRPDGRALDEIRPIWCENSILPRVHGSAVFTRGQTQVMTICTLGSISEVQKLEGLDDEVCKRYLHHYNFPGYSVGEAKPSRGPGRREIGHGALAERALEPMLPSEDSFPYVIRTVSEVLTSNGSTSQASVCGSTLALMDAGVPIKKPVAGVAMGLISSEDKSQVAVLTDIQGLEDFLGDMDFKVAGTDTGITAIQMDIKIKGINEEILRKALSQARVGRLAILDKMLEVLPEPKKNLSEYAPKIVSFRIKTDKIKDVIGSGGKTINKIIDETGVKIDINDLGDVFISSVSQDSITRAKSMIELIVYDPEIGAEFDGKVTKIIDAGAFVEISPVKEAFVRVANLKRNKNDFIDKVSDVVNVGDKVKIKVLEIGMKGISAKLLEVVGK